MNSGKIAKAYALFCKTLFEDHEQECDLQKHDECMLRSDDICVDDLHVIFKIINRLNSLNQEALLSLKENCKNEDDKNSIKAIRETLFPDSGESKPPSAFVVYPHPGRDFVPRSKRKNSKGYGKKAARA